MVDLYLEFDSMLESPSWGGMGLLPYSHCLDSSPRLEETSSGFLLPAWKFRLIFRVGYLCCCVPIVIINTFLRVKCKIVLWCPKLISIVWPEMAFFNTAAGNLKPSQGLFSMPMNFRPDKGCDSG